MTNQLADCLSGLGDRSVPLKSLNYMCIRLHNKLSARSDSLQKLRLSTQADDELGSVETTIMQGWPSSIKQVPPYGHSERINC